MKSSLRSDVKGQGHSAGVRLAPDAVHCLFVAFCDSGAIYKCYDLLTYLLTYSVL